MVSLSDNVRVVCPHRFTAQGIELVLYFKTMRIYLARRRNPRKCDAFYAIFSTVMFLMVTIWVSVISMLGHNMWLLDSTSMSGNAANVLWDCAGVVRIVLQQMTDGLMVRPSGPNVAAECGPYSLRSRCTVVEWCGTAFASSLYPPSCGSQPLVSIISSLVSLISSLRQISHRNHDRSHARAQSHPRDFS